MEMETLSWMEQVMPPGEHVVAPAGVHVLCFLTGSPFRLEQTREGKTSREFATRGMMQVISEGEQRVFRHQSAAQNIHVLLPPRLLLHFDAPETQITPRVSFRSERIAHLILALKPVGDATPDSAMNRLFRDSVGIALVAALQETPEEKTIVEALTPARSRRVLELIHDRLEENLSLDELASAAGLRPSQFTAQFRATFGMPPHRYLLEQRVRKAMDLLRQGQQTPAAVALAVGFYDQSHLTRHMRRLFGVTPRQIAASR